MTAIENQTSQAKSQALDGEKRAFLNKFAKTALAGAGMSILMTPSLSSANHYAGKAGFKGGVKHAERYFKIKRFGTTSYLNRRSSVRSFFKLKQRTP